ncbi:ABC transporter ATP-binding protein [Rothia nasimurium]|uniref:ABC transporter ATP-binding protein n=1 Tax=Rothia nasimurium TaxID=85336 RepID=A0A1Y1RR30_9MICC|nr:ATP-binding cassette domain-containing protein [Rothia nasimurium]ORC22179.1 ABC transporter ATP-binding protein [Rothia nasimurium]
MTDHNRIEVRGLTKVFGTGTDAKTVVEDASFTVEPGSMTGFLGANGAGKTTSMRMMMGLLEPTAGQVLYRDRPITAADRAGFGYMPEERGLYPKQPILSQLIYLGQLRGMSAVAARTVATEHLTELGLGERLNDKLESLSLGNQQRVQIVASILHQPTALILDEPFSGLDPKAVDTLVSMMRELMRTGVPILFSSHQLDLVDRLCDRVVILHRGTVRAQGAATELRESGTPRYLYRGGVDAAWLRDIPGITVLDVNGTEATLEFAPGTQMHELRAQILREGLSRDMHEFSRQLPTLGEIYRKVTGQ